MCLHTFAPEWTRTNLPQYLIMKVAVIGSRSFSNYDLLKKTLDEIAGIKIIISGGAAGADTLAEQWAKENNVETVIYKPDWAKYGRGAGIVRNRLIIEDCDNCIAFWDGVSKGTQNSIEMCKKLNRNITVHRYQEGPAGE